MPPSEAGNQRALSRNCFLPNVGKTGDQGLPQADASQVPVDSPLVTTGPEPPDQSAVSLGSWALWGQELSGGGGR